MILALFVFASVVAPSPSPSAEPLKTIVNVHSSPACGVVRDSALYITEGLSANNRIIEGSKVVLLRMGSELAPVGTAGTVFDALQAQWGTTPGGTHDTNPSLVMDNQRLRRLADELLHNLSVINVLLNDQARFPSSANVSAEKMAALKEQLLSVASEQQKNLNLLYGLVDTFSLQDLIAKGDGTQGVINDAGGVQVSHNDQDVSFQDITTGPSRGRIGHAVDPTVDTDPAISQKPTDLSNNPMARFYTSVVATQQSTAQNEDVLAKTMADLVATCH